MSSNQTILLLVLLLTLDISLGQKRRRLVDMNRRFRDKCNGKYCCDYRDSDQKGPIDGINCNLLNIDECTALDDVCIWDCDPHKTRRKGHFYNFDEGVGKIIHPNNDRMMDTDTDLDDMDIADNHDHDPETVEEMKEYSSTLQRGECGAVYKFDIDEEEAQIRLDRLKTNPKGQSRDSIGNNNDLDISMSGVDLSPEEMDAIRRRLYVYGPDGRSQVYATSYPYQTSVLLHLYENGYCSGTMISAYTILTSAHCVYDTLSGSWVSWIQALISADSTDDYNWKNVDYYSTSIMTAYVNLGGWSYSYDVALIRLLSNPGVGWLGFGYDIGLGTMYMNTFGYHYDRGYYKSLWKQYCNYNGVYSDVWTSNECDLGFVGDAGPAGSCNYLYYPSTGERKIYAITSWHYSSYNVYTRITYTIYNFICNFITEGGENYIC